MAEKHLGMEISQHKPKTFESRVYVFVVVT